MGKSCEPTSIKRVLSGTVAYPFSVTLAYRWIGHLHLSLGDLHQAIFALEHALRLCQRFDSPSLLPNVRSALGYAYALSGRSAEAVSLMKEAILVGTMEGQSLATILQGEVYLLAGRFDEAVQSAGRALEISRTHKERGRPLPSCPRHG